MSQPSLEKQLIGEDLQDFDPAFFAPVLPEGIQIDNETGDLKAQERPEDEVLIGSAAMEFLGLPTNRQGNLLQRGDWGKIHRRFEALIKQYLATGRDDQHLFWKMIKIKVWNLKNVGQYTADNKPYAGEIYDGRGLSGLVPDEEKSPNHQKFRVQLHSVKATEDMKNVLRRSW